MDIWEMISPYLKESENMKIMLTSKELKKYIYTIMGDVIAATIEERQFQVYAEEQVTVFEAKKEEERQFQEEVDSCQTFSALRTAHGERSEIRWMQENGGVRDLEKLNKFYGGSGRSRER